MTEQEVYTPMRHKRPGCLVTAIAWVILVSCGSPMADSIPTAIPDAPGTGSTPPTAGAGYGGFGPGETSLKERIANSDIIVRASVSSVAGTVDVAEDPDIFVVYIDFHLRVHEYLKGSGPDDLIAVVWAGGHFDTRQEAQDQLPSFLAERNSRWEERQAIIFLNDSVYYVPRTEQSGYYFLAASDSWDDGYSLASETDKRWLPSARPPGGAGGAAGSAGEFLLSEPQAQAAARSGGASETTVTLGALKELITTVKARLNANGGSEHQKDCVRQTYLLERSERHVGIHNLGLETYPTHTCSSGQARVSVVWQDSRGSGYLPDGPRAQVWLDNGDADLFAVTFGPATRVDEDGDGTDDGIVYDRHVVSARPLPAGEYRFQFNDRGAFFVICEGFTFRYEWTVTVTSPPGVLHEAFFDPVAVGTAVKADGSNGVLRPASFTDATDGSATIQSLSYEPPAASRSGTVKLQVDLHTGLVGHVVDFIELDGSVSLSLGVADAAVDAADKTLSWSVASQPWDDGDQLMLRIRESSP